MGSEGMKTPVSKAQGLELDIPQFKKCLFCLPLKAGLMTFGVLHMVAAVVVIVFSIIHAMDVTYYYGAPAALTHTVGILISAVDIVAFSVLVAAAYNDNIHLLNTSYLYLTVKVCLYAFMIVLSAILWWSLGYEAEEWYERYIDPARSYLLMKNAIAGILDLLLFGYLTLLVRSQVLALGGAPRLVGVRFRLQIVFDDPERPEYSAVGSKKEKEREELHNVE